MPICKKCHNSFPNEIIIDGKPRFLSNRKNCLECSPFGSRNSKNKEPDCKETKKCTCCETILPLNYFSLTKKGGTKRASYCNECVRKLVCQKRNNFKTLCINYLGGKCLICGYHRYQGALECHHLDPNLKEFNFSSYPHYAYLTTETKKELDKCVLLCTNCHRETESGFYEIYKDEDDKPHWKNVRQ